MVNFTRYLFSQGVDGITIFGTTGEGPEFCVSDRMATLDALISAGIEPQRIMVSVARLPLKTRSRWCAMQPATGSMVAC